MCALHRSLHRMPGPVIRKALGVVQLTAVVGVPGVVVAAVLGFRTEMVRLWELRLQKLV